MPSSPESIAEAVNRLWAPATCRAETFNEADRTVDVIWTAGATVRRHGWRDGPYNEELLVSRQAVRLGRLNGGAPVLNSHAAYDLANVIGTVVPGSARIERGRGVATIKLSGRAEIAGIVRDIADGVLSAVSVGYRVHKSERIEAGDDEVATVRVTDWEPLELSVVPIPADPEARIRADAAHQSRNQNMPHPLNRGRFTPDPNADPNEIEEGRDPAPAPVFGARQRRELATRYLPADDVAAFVRDHARLNEGAFRDAILDELADRQDAAPTFPVVETRGMNDGLGMRAAMTEALVHRANPALVPQLSPEARPFAYASLMDLARQCVEAGGTNARGMAPSEIVRRAFHTTSDFPALLTDSAQRTLLPAYQAARSGLHRLARQATAKDFRPIKRVRATNAVDLEKVNEHGEFKRGTMTEGGESYQIKTFGKIFGLTRQAVINDDLGAFVDVSAMLGQSAARFEDEFLTALIESNPDMADGNPVFHAAHGNLAASGAAVAEDKLSAARLAMRSQTDPAGKKINVAAKFLLVAPKLETTAEKVLATIAAAKTSDVNPFAGKLELVVNPYFEDEDEWYCVADPAALASLEYAYLLGAEGPQFETRNGFDIDGVEWKVRLDFGGGWIDHRAWYKNPGA